MKNIYLIGDSIRYGATDGNSPGYGIYVQELLRGRANVYGPDDNCRFAQYTLRYLTDWAAQVDAASIDVVHWNNGLWDVLRIMGDDPLTPVDAYRELLGRVYRRIRRLFPNAKVIFATTTAVLEEAAKPDFIRYNADIMAYNRAACDLMDALQVEVNDLFEITENYGESLHADWVHFNATGCRLIADRVAAAVMK